LADGPAPGAREGFAARYDAMILDPPVLALYGGSGFYNVGDWSRGARSLPEACAHLVERHLDLLADPPPERLLDIGCGLGAGTVLAARRFPGSRVLGVNLSAAQLARARRRRPGPRYLAMDAARLAVASGSVDRVMAVEAAFHFHPRTAFLAEAHRVLAPGGAVVLSDILFTGGPWVGAWSVPAVNFVADLAAYGRICRAAGLTVEILEDLTAVTWEGFRQHLGQAGLTGLAEDLGRCGARYLLARLRKPQ
jgi:MPBQ/MSBQ methyltransferase